MAKRCPPAAIGCHKSLSAPVGQDRNHCVAIGCQKAGRKFSNKHHQHQHSQPAWRGTSKGITTTSQLQLSTEVRKIALHFPSYPAPFSINGNPFIVISSKARGQHVVKPFRLGTCKEHFCFSLRPENVCWRRGSRERSSRRGFSGGERTSQWPQ